MMDDLTDQDWWPTSFLQYALKDKEYVLQQKWIKQAEPGKGSPPRYEWRDVPVAEVPTTETVET